MSGARGERLELATASPVSFRLHVRERQQYHVKAIDTSPASRAAAVGAAPCRVRATNQFPPFVSAARRPDAVDCRCRLDRR